MPSGFSRAYSRAMCQLRDLHREEFDELLAAARVDVDLELEAEAITMGEFLLTHTLAENGVAVYEEGP